MSNGGPPVSLFGQESGNKPLDIAEGIGID